MTPKLFFIIGAAESGKSTLAKALAQQINGWCHDTSQPIILQYEKLTGYKLKPAEKNQYRKELIAIGDVMCSRNPGRLTETILDLYRQRPTPVVICGIRRVEELVDSMLVAAQRGYEPAIIRITRPDYQSPSDNFNLATVDVDHDLINDGQPLTILEMVNTVLDS